MIKLHIKSLFVIILLLAVNLTAGNDIDVAAIRQAIKDKGANWIAGETWLTDLPPQERKYTMGLVREQGVKRSLYKLPPVGDLPPRFSWRENGGDFITPVRNQGVCGSCSYFASIAAAEAFWRIKTGNPRLDIDLSEQYILSCGSVGDCENGAMISGVLRYLRTHGAPSEGCLPYQENDKVPCSDACPDASSQLTKIGDYIAFYDELDVESIKNAVYHRPVIVDMEIFSDFMSYMGGVYEHVTGDYEGGHAVIIYGWDDSEQAWLCKNSWGKTWGEKGHFRIKWGEADIARNVFLIWDDARGAPRLSVSPQSLNVTLSPGETTTRYLEIGNTGSGQLEFVAKVSGDKMPTAYFHSSSFQAVDGQSWWCGSERLGGYDNHWLQYLDTPLLDLTRSQSPELTFDALWSVNADSCDELGYDSWDGCNVWISGDGGRTFQVVRPVQPEYNCTSLYSFGSVWGKGYNVPGWNGRSSQWQKVRFDLSDFKSSRTVIRFAFASDKSGCSRDNPELKGFFIDNITVKDGQSVLFSDSAELNSPMRPTSAGSADMSWIYTPFAAGSIEAGESITIPVELTAFANATGTFIASVQITNNHIKSYPREVPVFVSVSRPTHDVGLGKTIWPPFTVPQYMNITPTVVLNNWGTSRQDNIAVSCRIVDEDGQELYRDQVYSSLASGQAAGMHFPGVAVQDTGDYEIIFKIENATSVANENRSNDEMHAWFHTRSIVDDFENPSELWDYGQGWGRTSNFSGGFKSRFAMHVNSGAKYENNMDNSLTFNGTFNLANVPDAVLRFWTRYSMERGKDYLLVQATRNGQHWVTLDSLTGSNLRWHERNVAMAAFVGPGNEAVKIRFRFISNDSRTAIGVMLDNIRIAAQTSTGTESVLMSTARPKDFKLHPNYPNPFNPTTTIPFYVPEDAFVRLVVLNINGQIVDELVARNYSRGSHSIAWNAQESASGLYIVKMMATTRNGKRFVLSEKMLLLK